ncbi:antA/AntB antirepressor family protein [Chondrinema litorale]|uniref:antA/AntB antirepressor family protein n=1 Tax=Chondrinema litorale TaxID=2994555 RepID=UPI002543A69B|nr:antA/AntB antirepressor family protein [Chondrinema litorale]UZR98614.1 antA/AntB antirepressor family protein [Chondrinema litorale]
MELVKIYEGNLVNARELHEFLEVKTVFRNWIRRMLEYGFEENLDYFTASKKVHRQILKEFYLTLSAAKEISMLQRTDKGREARKYFIRCEEQLVHLSQNKRFAAFIKLESTKEKFKNALIDLGLSEQDYIEIDFAGRKILFNGEPIPDEELQTVLLSARDLATNMTHYNALQNKIENKEDIKSDNKANHSAVRETLVEKNIVPENIPNQKSIKKLGE